MSRIKDLKKSPLFNISKCSKELAHSNFWAWLIEIEIDNKNPFIEIFVRDFYKNGYSFVKVDREKDNRDLTIWYKDNKDNKKCIVIENKIKSIPTVEQLNKYEEKLNKKSQKVFTKGILTGIKQTLDLNGLNWVFLSYSEIIKNMSKINKQVNNETTYEYMTIDQYCKDIDNLTSIIKNELKNTENKYTKTNIKLAELKFQDVFLKFKADEFTNYLNKKLSNKKFFSKEWGNPEAYHSFNRGKATITCIYKEMLNDVELGRIGIQVEGDEFRILSGTSRQYLNIENCKDYYNKLKKLGWYEEFEKGGTIRNRRTSMRGGKGIEKEILPFKKYRNDKDGNTYTHLYQSWKIDYVPISYDEIYKEIEKELLKAKELIDKKQISFKE